MTDEIEKILENFASSKRSGAIALTGPWGVGKTYLWQQRVMPKVIAKPWEKRYSYVSLFGINSLSELKIALAAATDEFDQDARRQKRLTASCIRRFWRIWRWVSDLLGLVPRTGVGLSKLFERVGFYLVRGRIICFDDIERHGKQLDLRDFLGLVSYLSEQRECRVVVILNEGQLNEDDLHIWESYREKVFQGEIAYTPTPEQTVELGLQEDVGKRWHGPLYQALMELGIRNIRLVRRSSDFMRLIDDAIDIRALRQETTDGMVRAVAMLVFSVHGRGAGGPPLELIKRVGRFDMAVYQGKGEDDRTEPEKRWDQLISAYRLYLHTDLDHALVFMVKQGFPDVEKLRAAIDEVESNNELYAWRQDWIQAWRLYHDTVAENGAEIVAEFERTWPRVSASEHANNLESTVRILRMLGRADIASRFIQGWVDERSGGREDELESHNLHMFRKIKDSEILEVVEAARGRAIRSLPLREAFNVVRASKGNSEQAIASFASANADEIIQLIDETVSEELAPTLRRILELRSNHANSKWVEASRNVQQACELIAARSALAADRMRNWFGIEPAPAEANTHCN